MNKTRQWVAASVLLMGAATAGAQAASPIRLAFNIPAQPLDTALTDFAQATGLQLLVLSDAAHGLTAPKISGSLTPENALKALLAGSGLSYQFVNPRTVAIRSAQAFNTSSQDRDSSESSNLAQSEVGGGETSTSTTPQSVFSALDEPRPIPQILVQGSRALNVDIERTRDDIQPYVVFDETTIKASGAPNIQEFLKQRLTMNSQTGSPAQGVGTKGSSSEVNLRGLGPNQTLILIDGRRTAGAYLGGTLGLQPDLSGIPLGAIERIEILPTTASGIYGGGATGGVINVVLKHDYSGAEVTLNYDSPFSSGSQIRRVDLASGFSLENGKTNIQISGSYSEQTALHMDERDFLREGRERILANNPSSFLSAASPPLGATTNIRSATVVGGVTQNLTLDNGTRLNSTFTSVPDGYSGTRSDNGQALVARAGQYNFDLANSAQFFGGGGMSLLSAPSVSSLSATVRRNFTESLQAFVDVLVSRNEGHVDRSALDLGGGLTGAVIPGNAPNNPFQQDIRVTVPISAGDTSLDVTQASRRGVLGLIYLLPGSWSTGLDYSWSKARVDYQSPNATSTATAIRTGALDVLRDTDAFPLDVSPFLREQRVSDLTAVSTNVSLRAAGPLVSLPAGPLVLSTLLERRHEVAADGTATLYSNTGPGTDFAPLVIFQEQKQTVKSVYAELSAPVFSAKNRITGIHELSFQVAARHDSYDADVATNTVTPGAASAPRQRKDFSSTDPTFGVRYRPLADITLRASYGTGLRPPSSGDLVSLAPTATTARVIDPRRGNELSGAVLQTSGGNIDVAPEQSESWSAGLVFTPSKLSGLRMSVDYTRIRKTDNISAYPSLQAVVDNEAFLPNRVTRGPASGGFGVGPIVGVDTSAANLARAEIEAFDGAIDWQLDTAGIGRFGFFALATWQPHYRTQVIDGAPLVENAGIANTLGINNSIVPIKIKATAGVNWSFRELTVGWATRYFDSYFVADPTLPSSTVAIANQGGARIPSQIYHDLNASYHVGRSLGPVDDGELRFGVRNIFNSKPPFDASNSSSGYYSLIGDPRLATYYVSVTARF